MEFTGAGGFWFDTIHLDKGEIMSRTAQQDAYIQQIRAFPAKLKAVLAEIPAEHLDKRVGEGEWSTRQIVHHLVDAHCFAIYRIHLPLFNEKPTLPEWQRDDFARLPDYQLPLDNALTLLEPLQERLAVLFESLTPEQWARIAIHQTRGEITVEQICAIYAGHGEAHLKQIADIRAKHGF